MASVFTGPLSRWYARTGGDPARYRVGVEAWRDDLRASVVEKVGEQLVWDEGTDVAVTHDLGDSGWMAVRLFAFYAERADLEMPDSVPPLLELDTDWRAASDAKFERSHYGQLAACRAWLPGDFPVTLRVPMPDGDSWEVGSIAVLADQLNWLNQRTFAADRHEIERWGALPAPAGGELLDAARRGFWGLRTALEIAVRERVPVVVREA